MKDKIVANVIMKMSDKIDSNQISQLKNALYIALEDCEITPRSTEIVDIDNTYMWYLNMFLIRKRIEGKSERTISHYQYILKNLLQSLNLKVENISENDLFCYLAKYKQDKNVSNSYLDGIRLVFSSFFTWLSNKGYIPRNPAIGLEPIKSDKKIKQPFNDEELERIRCACICERDRALVEFLYSTGVRVSELASLNRQDVDFYGKSMVVYGKGGKEREVYLTATASLHLKEYLDSRTDNEEALFVGIRKPYKRLGIAGLEKITKDLGKMAGVKHCHPHRFRRTMATNVLKRGAQLEEVKELLGHTKIDTTMIYCSIDKSNIKHTHQKLMGT